jgi:hypothetical protein
MLHVVLAGQVDLQPPFAHEMLQVAPGSHLILQSPPAQSKLQVAPFSHFMSQCPPSQRSEHVWPFSQRSLQWPSGQPEGLAALPLVGFVELASEPEEPLFVVLLALPLALPLPEAEPLDSRCALLPVCAPPLAELEPDPEPDPDPMPLPSAPAPALPCALTLQPTSAPDESTVKPTNHSIRMAILLPAHEQGSGRRPVIE